MRTGLLVASVTLWLFVVRAIAAPEVEIEKFVDDPTPDDGQLIEFEVEVRNVGDETAVDVYVNDLLPSALMIPEGMAASATIGEYDPLTGGWVIGDLAVDATETLVIPAMISTASPPVCITNVARVTAQEDTGIEGSEATAILRQSSTTDHCVDINVEIEDFRVNYCVGNEGIEVVIDVRVSNTGLDDARNVVVDISPGEIEIPKLRFRQEACEEAHCTIGTLSAGESIELGAKSKTFKPPKEAHGKLSAAFMASSDDFDVVPGNNSAIAHGAYRDEFCPSAAGGTGGCFIATAAYGSSLDKRIDLLRRFRDEQLSRSSAGRAFIRAYYKFSPAIADVIKSHNLLRTGVRFLLVPVLLVISYPRLFFCMVTVIFVSLGVQAYSLIARRLRCGESI